jgi:antitoxin component YwqK of YwqJK toxin-antitoxin module
MKSTLILTAVLFSGMMFAQENNPKLEVVGKMVKATYYHENGKVQQEGLFKDGKLDGVWTSYSALGNKISTGEYENGIKTGKWIFWNENNLTEVDYSNSVISTVKNSKREALALIK